jgi:hypothetical protein
VLNQAISKWDKTITPELWPFTIQHAATIFNTMKCRSHNYEEIRCEKFAGEISKLEQSDIHPLFCPVFVLDQRLQEGTYHPKWKQRNEQKVYLGCLHHYSWYVPLIWDPNTKLVSPQLYLVLFDDNFETVQPPNPEIKMDGNMDILFKSTTTNMMTLSGINTHAYVLTGE